MVGALLTMLAGIRMMKKLSMEVIDRLKGNPIEKGIEIAGYGYDPVQDIFYCNMNAWQRDMGYSRLYDEGCAPFGMILDCEAIYFRYGGKIWLIELWKGQYDLNTGCEVGVYTREEPMLNIPEMYKYMFYNCATNEDRLTMSFSLYRNEELLFSRDDKHWWLAGFKLGEYSEPWELTMELSITLKDQFMRAAFVEGLKEAGYEEKELKINGNSVGLTYSTPRTPQPITRTPETDRIIQVKNKLLCEKYNDIVKVYDGFADRMNAVKKYAPEIYEEIIDKAKIRSYLRSVKNPESI